MAELENSKDLISVLWNGADILRSKMDANEYKDYLLGIVFYKYLSDSNSKNEFNVGKYIARRLTVKPDDVFDCCELEAPPDPPAA